MNVPQLLILRAHVGRYRILPCKQTVAPSFSLLAISLSPLHSSRSLSLRTLPFLASRDLVVISQFGTDSPEQESGIVCCGCDR